MTIKRVDITKNITYAMQYTAEKQKVIAGNIAQANIPGAKSKTLKPIDFKKLLANTKRNDFNLKITSPTHIKGKERPDYFDVIDNPNANEMTPSGNNIVLADEMKSASDNNVNYTEFTRMFSKFMGMLKSTITGRV